MNRQLETFRRILSEEAGRLSFTLSPRELDALGLHYELLRKWNPHARLTAAIEPERAAIELFADCFAACAFADSLASESSGTAPHVIDIGAGAGLPGVPLNILRPEWRLTIVETNAKKVAFLKTLVREVALKKTTIKRGRAETIAREDDLRGRFDLAFCRAVGVPAIACELAVPFLAIGGTLIVQTILHPFSAPPEADSGGDTAWGDILHPIRSAAAVLNATIVKTRSYKLSNVHIPRALIAVQKTDLTPSRYPRDPRSIKKQPIA